MKKIRLASGLGFYGDNWEPVRAAIEFGDVHYICSDHLAELTLAILRKDQARDAAAGFTRDLVPMLSSLWPMAQQAGVKFILNAGGLNPRGAGEALRAAFKAKGWTARIAVVTGDALLDRIDALRAGGEALAHLDTGADIDAVRERLVFANAYLGAAPIVQALAQGADIVITGRVADAALFLAPLVHEFGWPLQPSDAAGWSRLAQGLCVGHLLECSGQGAGGNFGAQGAWQQVPDLAHIGYPIAEVFENGSAVITKAPGTGGRINFHTLRQQLLYEVHDPRRYLSPDVVLDLGAVQLDELGPNRVRLSGAAGSPPPDTLKLVAGYEDGWMGQALVGFCWPDALAKARAVVAGIKTQLQEKRMAHEELCVEFLGHDSFLGPHADTRHEAALNEVWLRMAVRCADRRVAEAFPRLFPWMALSGPPFMGGFHGIQPASQLLGLWPSQLRREHIEAQVQVEVTRPRHEAAPGRHRPCAQR
jgi:hypothetical protein